MTAVDSNQVDTTAAIGIANGDTRLRGVGNLRRHTARGMVINSAYQVGIVGLSALRGVVMAAFLTRADYGVWGFIGLALWTTLGLKGVFGAGERYVQQSDEDQEQAFQRAFTVEAIFAAASAPVVAAVVVVFAFVTGHLIILAPGLTLLLLLPSTVLQFPLATFYRRMDYRRQRTLSAADPVVGTIVSVALAVLGLGYWSFVIGLVAGSWAGAIVVLRACPYRIALRYDRGTLGRYVRFSAPLLIGGLSVLAMFQVIFLVGNAPLGLAGLGAFTLVGNLVQFTDQADAIVTETLYPAVCAVRDRIGLLSEVFVKSNRLSLIWAVPFGVGVTLFASDLIRLVLGHRWLPAVSLLEIMGIVTAVHHVGYNWGAFFKARGTTGPIGYSGAIVAGVVIAAAIPLMYSHHLLGLGLAFIAGEVVALIIRSVLIARLFHGVSILRHLLRAFAPGAVAAGAVLGLRALAGHETTLLAAIAVFALYVAVTITATAAFEGPLLREAVGYLMGGRRSAAPRIADVKV